MNNNFSYKKEFNITTNMLDCYDYLKLSSILDFMQCVASEHADILGVGFDNFIKKSLIWVVIRNKVEILDSLKDLKNISIRTSLVKPRLFECPRDYEIFSGDKLIIKGRSIWAIYDLNNKKIILPNDYDSLFSKDIGLYNRIKKIDLIDKNLLKFNSYRNVNFTMLDHNKHMNNTHYLDLFMDIYKPTKEIKISSFQVEYVSQCYLDDKISIYTYEILNKKYLYGYCNDELKFYIEVDVNESNN